MVGCAWRLAPGRFAVRRLVTCDNNSISFLLGVLALAGEDPAFLHDAWRKAAFGRSHVCWPLRPARLCQQMAPWSAENARSE